MVAALWRVYAGICRRDRLTSKKCPFWAPELPLGRKFPSKRIFWHLEGNIKGNDIWKEIGTKFGYFEGKRKEILRFKLFQ